MEAILSTRIYVSEVSQVGEARRAASVLAEKAGLSENRRGEVGIVVTELGTNLVQHTKGGQILLRTVSRGDASGIEILSLDSGPGIGDIDRCLTDGYSTSGTPGNGLGAIIRLSSEFDIYSKPVIGTAIWSRIWPTKDIPKWNASANAHMEFGVVCIPIKGEVECGDSWSLQPIGGGTRCMLVDGLGHGPGAAEASAAAVEIFSSKAQEELEPLVNTMHNGMRHTRGAAVAVADIIDDAVCYVGVGNICGAILTDGSMKSMVSHNGTIGHQIRKIKEFSYPFASESIIVMHSDGLGTQWRLDKWPGLIARHPSLIAGILYRDFARERDDVTVFVARQAGND
jgi:anti-sigma regulatory factor (Ser/Thr protein kinase)